MDGIGWRLHCSTFAAIRAITPLLSWITWVLIAVHCLISVNFMEFLMWPPVLMMLSAAFLRAPTYSIAAALTVA